MPSSTWPSPEQCRRHGQPHHRGQRPHRRLGACPGVASPSSPSTMLAGLDQDAASFFPDWIRHRLRSICCLPTTPIAIELTTSSGVSYPSLPLASGSISSHSSRCRASRGRCGKLAHWTSLLPSPASTPLVHRLYRSTRRPRLVHQELAAIHLVAGVGRSGNTAASVVVAGARLFKPAAGSLPGGSGRSVN